MIELLFPAIEKELLSVISVLEAVFQVLFFVLLVVAEWHLFKKFGEKSWKALIPFYSQYLMFKYTWRRSAFWWYLVGTLGFLLLFGASEAVALARPNDVAVDILIVAALPFAIVSLVYAIISNLRIAESFGKGVVYGLFLSLVYEILVAVLAFGKSEYVKNNGVQSGRESREVSQLPS